MKIGVQTFVTDETMTPTEWAQELEDRGFDCFMQPEHPHVPVERSTPYPDAYGGGELPDFYKRPYDPFVGCGFAAAGSTRLLVGTGICLVALRDPVITAKAVASVDRLSGGRFIFGIGFGWNADEFATHNQPFRQRFSLVREKVAAMRELWQHDVASYEGTHVQLPPSWSWPKPLQRPHPPLYVGGSGPTTMRHAAAWGDVWYPTPPTHDRTLEKSVPEFRALVEREGRDADQVGVAVAAAPADTGLLAGYRELGIRLVTIRLRSKPRDEALAELDTATKVADTVRRG
jgi:probable F420-dependent oxidoreductase